MIRSLGEPAKLSQSSGNGLYFFENAIPRLYNSDFPDFPVVPQQKQCNSESVWIIDWQ